MEDEKPDTTVADSPLPKTAEEEKAPVTPPCQQPG